MPHTTPSTNHIFYISGGAGKNIMATVVISNIKKKFPHDKIIVITPHQDIWKNNPNVDSIEYAENSTKIYVDFIFKKQSKIYALEPYSTEDYFYEKKYLAEIWCDLYGIPYIDRSPSLYLEDAEIETVKKKIEDGVIDTTNKKIFLIQTNGGAPNQPYPISWPRDLPLPIAEEVCKKMVENGYRPIHLRRKDQYPLKNAEWFDLSLRESLCLIHLSEKRLFIDSLAQHAAAAINKPSVVIWVSNPPSIFGYEMHTNILSTVKPEFRHRIDSFLERYNITGNIHECPYSTNILFSADEIVKKLLI